jgi:hypothetical protein
MPALPNVPKVLKMLLRFADTDDNDMMLRLFFAYAGTAPTDADLITLGAAIGNAWAARLASFWTTNQNVTEILLEDLTSSVSAAAQQVLAHPGTRAGTPVPNAVNVNLHHVIARRYRGGHPKSFLTALVDGDRADVAHWDPTTLVNLTNAWNLWMSDINAAVWAGGTSLTPVNVSYYQGFTNFTYPSGRTRPRPTLRATPVVDQLLGFQASTKIGSQRRRYR